MIFVFSVAGLGFTLPPDSGDKLSLGVRKLEFFSKLNI